MTLTTHGILGAATASLLPGSYPIAWTAAFLSHFLSDAIPHWDYHTHSMKKALNPLMSDFVITRKSGVDIAKIAVDFGLGMFLGYLLFYSPSYNPWLLLGGAFFGILPDPLQFLYWKTRREPLTSLQKFHVGIHAKTRIQEWYVGIPVQIAIILVATGLAYELQNIIIHL
ncbi:MAG: hypothetical protein AAB691_03090 [Patescibacteria group bacterium]